MDVPTAASDSERREGRDGLAPARSRRWLGRKPNPSHEDRRMDVPTAASDSERREGRDGLAPARSRRCLGRKPNPSHEKRAPWALVAKLAEREGFEPSIRLLTRYSLS